VFRPPPFYTLLTCLDRFRELCEEVPAVKALGFLQNDVSTAVDHNNPEETSVFRSLLSHLLVPSKPTTPAISRRQSDPDTTGAESESEDSGAPPKKRSRQSTPDETWTSRLDEDAAMAESVSSDHSVQSHRAIITMKEDPEESGLRDTSNTVSAERFQQRTEVFESLLKFVGKDAKQPSGNLLDIMSGVEEEDL
jgi:muskelin